MQPCEFLGVLKDVVLDEVSSKVADVVAADARFYKRELLEMTASSNILLPKIGEECSKIFV